MRPRHHLLPVLVSLSVLAAGLGAVPAAAAQQRDEVGLRHVLLISVDGLHASDVNQCVALGICPTIEALGEAGTTYADAQASVPSDSSPGLVALVSGASPKLSGVYYDDSYDRTMYAPPAQTPSGTQDCSGAPGAEAMYFENIDTGAPTYADPNGTRPILGNTIDPAQLGRAVVGGRCVAVWPNDFLRTNTVFSVAHAAGLRTAWADKHPAADRTVAGHGTPNAVDDPFMTEINADVVPASLVDTRGRTVSFPHPNATGDPNGWFITDSVGNTEAYDQIKVDAILNEVDGRTSGGTGHPGTPAIFGLNFQSVSVAQKLVDPWLSCVRSGNAPGCDPSYFPGGYQPGSLTFTPQLRGAIRFVDGALGSIVGELRDRHLLASTEIILTAKHGQSPIDPSRLAKIGHAEADVLASAGVGVAQLTDDDVALVWLADQSQTGAAVAALAADQAGPNTARVSTVLSGTALAARFGDPRTDPRTPDLIVQPIPGTIYSHSRGKVAEHGGFAPDDTHVALIVTDGRRLLADHDRDAGERDARAAASSTVEEGRVVWQPVGTVQVAPTILAALGLDPERLDAVRIEHTRVLPWALDDASGS